VRLGVLVLALALPGGVEPAAVPLRPRAPELSRPQLAIARLELAPEASASRSRGDGPLTAEERARRDAVVDALLAAEAQATESPETAEGPLQDALRGFFEVAPLVAGDARAQEARAFALLALARTRLVLGRPQDAAAAVDDAMITIHQGPLPVDQFGPAMAVLVDERATVLAPLPMASLTVRCSVPCLMLVDEQPFTDALVPGAHRVWVEALAPGLPVLRRALRLAPGESVELRYDVEAPAPAPRPLPSVPAAAKRVLPRWASVLGVAVGAGAVASGGVLVGVDLRCPDLGDPRQVPQCLRVLNTDTGGFVLLGVGSAMLVTAAVILAVDEIRARRARSSR
jgi:hypothetical protein